MSKPRQISFKKQFGGIIFANIDDRVQVKLNLWGHASEFSFNKTEIRKLRDWFSHWLSESGQ